jgi:hypothetical protein
MKRALLTLGIALCVVSIIILNGDGLEASVKRQTTVEHSKYLVTQAQMNVDQLEQFLDNKNPYGFDSKPLEQVYKEIYKNLNEAKVPIEALTYKGESLSDQKLRQILYACLDKRCG